MRKVIAVLFFLILSFNTVFAQDATSIPSKCQVSLDSGRSVVTGSCSVEELIGLMKSLSSNLGVSAESINVSIPLPIMIVNANDGLKATFYPGAKDSLIQMVNAIKPLAPDLWLKPFNEPQNGYAATNGYYFDQGLEMKCDNTDQGCQISVAGRSYFAATGDVRVPKLGYQCTLDDTSDKKYGCTLIIVNQASQEATFVIGSPVVYTWTGKYFNGGNVVDDSLVPVEIKPVVPALSVALWAMASNLTHSMITTPGDCAASSGCDGNNVTIIFTSGPTIIARWDAFYEKST